MPSSPCMILVLQNCQQIFKIGGKSVLIHVSDSQILTVKSELSKARSERITDALPMPVKYLACRRCEPAMTSVKTTVI